MSGKKEIVETQFKRSPGSLIDLSCKMIMLAVERRRNYNQYSKEDVGDMNI